jgi:uncharacterized protein YuzE
VTTENGVLTVTYDADVHAAYIRLQLDDVVQPRVVETLPVTDSINLDFDHDGRLVGIELLSERLLHPAVLAEALR